VTSSFRALTEVRREATDRFLLEVDESAFIVRGPNGGYVAAVLMRALQERIADLDDTIRPPRSMTIHYPAPPTVGDAVITTEIVRAGRSLVTASARLEQDGKTMSVALAAFSPAWPGEEWHDAPQPDIAGPDEVGETSRNRPPLPFTSYWDYRFTRGHVVDPDGPAAVDAWIRLAQPEPIDGPVVTAMTDAFPPAVFARSDAPNPVPTVDLTIHFRTGIPHDGFDPDSWVLGSFRTRTIAEGFLEESGELWTEDGHLLAQSRQLAITLPG
jgi:acyl-CoA thioesterase